MIRDNLTRSWFYDALQILLWVVLLVGIVLAIAGTAAVIAVM